MTPDQLSAIRAFAVALPPDGTAPDTAILQLVSEYADMRQQFEVALDNLEMLRSLRLDAIRDADDLRQQLAAMREQVPVGRIDANAPGGFYIYGYNPPKLPEGTELYAAPVPPADAVRDAHHDLFTRWLEYAVRMRSRGQPIPQPLYNETDAILAAKGDGQ